MVHLPKMTEKEIENIINEQFLCRIAFKGEEYPYITPFQYVCFNNTLYFHFTDYGKKIRLLERDNRVCVEIEKYLNDLSEYSFVSIRGHLEKVIDPIERSTVIKLLALRGKKQISTIFLAAHGLKTEEGWDSFVPEKPLVIMKLVKIKEKIGLKSP
jgi:nitroimidazol reductase NimA-like FMN-containing flavoprotein (pyridoxamine 5'-phosphate oxidase superfamily)